MGPQHEPHRAHPVPTPPPGSRCPSPAPVRSPQGQGSLAGHRGRASQGPPGGRWGQSSQEGLLSRLPPAGTQMLEAVATLAHDHHPEDPRCPQISGAVPSSLRKPPWPTLHPSNFLGCLGFPVSNDLGHHGRSSQPCLHGGLSHHCLGRSGPGGLPSLHQLPTGQLQEAHRAIRVTGSGPSRALGAPPSARPRGGYWVKHQAGYPSTSCPLLRLEGRTACGPVGTTSCLSPALRREQGLPLSRPSSLLPLWLSCVPTSPLHARLGRHAGSSSGKLDSHG